MCGIVGIASNSNCTNALIEGLKKYLLSQNKKEETFPIAGINIPAKVVSGDFYNFSELGNRCKVEIISKTDLLRARGFKV